MAVEFWPDCLCAHDGADQNLAVHMCTIVVRGCGVPLHCTVVCPAARANNVMMWSSHFVCDCCGLMYGGGPCVSLALIQFSSSGSTQPEGSHSVSSDAAATFMTLCILILTSGSTCAQLASCYPWPIQPSKQQLFICIYISLHLMSSWINDPRRPTYYKVSIEVYNEKISMDLRVGTCWAV